MCAVTSCSLHVKLTGVSKVLKNSRHFFFTLASFYTIPLRSTFCHGYVHRFSWEIVLNKDNFWGLKSALFAFIHLSDRFWKKLSTFLFFFLFTVWCSYNLQVMHLNAQKVKKKLNKPVYLISSSSFAPQ